MQRRVLRGFSDLSPFRTGQLTLEAVQQHVQHPSLPGVQFRVLVSVPEIGFIQYSPENLFRRAKPMALICPGNLPCK